MTGGASSLPVTVINIGIPRIIGCALADFWLFSSARPAGKELYSAGFAWTRMDKIQNTQCADEGRSALTDKWRTERAIHIAIIGDPQVSGHSDGSGEAVCKTVGSA